MHDFISKLYYHSFWKNIVSLNVIQKWTTSLYKMKRLPFGISSWQIIINISCLVFRVLPFFLVWLRRKQIVLYLKRSLINLFRRSMNKEKEAKMFRLLFALSCVFILGFRATSQSKSSKQVNILLLSHDQNLGWRLVLLWTTKILIISIFIARFKISRTFTYSSKYSKGFCGRKRKPKSKLKNQII